MMGDSHTNVDPVTNELRELRARVAEFESKEARRRQADQEREVFARLSTRVAGAASTDEVMRVVWEESERLLGWDCCYLMHRQLAKEALRVAFYVDTEDGQKKVFPGEDRPLSEFSPTVQRVFQGERILINRTPEDPGPVMTTRGTKRISASLMFVPVRCGEELTGVLSVQSYTPRRYCEADIRLVQQIADAVAPAIRRVYAEDQLRDAHDALERRVEDRTAELRAVNEQLRREIAERERLTQAVEHAAEGIAIWDGQLRLTYCNAAFPKVFGWKQRDEVLGRVWSSFFARDEAGANNTIAAVLASGGTWDGRLRGNRRSGEIVPLSVTFSRFQGTDGTVMIVGSFRDASTEEAHLAQIRKLRASAEAGLEAERARISRELHDELGQLVTALSMDLAWVGRRLTNEDSSVRERITQMNDIVRRVTAGVRDLSKSLRPSLLDHTGLIEAIQSHVAEFGRRTGITCHVAVEPSQFDVSDPLATAVFRIVQEALTNVARHSQASCCQIALRLQADILDTEILDNGVGTDTGKLDGEGSLGVLGMRERAAALGGTVRVENHPAGGLRVSVRLPLN